MILFIIVGFCYYAVLTCEGNDSKIIRNNINNQESANSYNVANIQKDSSKIVYTYSGLTISQVQGTTKPSSAPSS